ncbi:MAG: hypothetical protein ATN31_04925 [Candidatus Epulonipiscioides saccharophilum]|nr:MAG: hypothetical protein ATN31_04925 [Epulopiscium sp. AS2M-Bin001]
MKVISKENLLIFFEAIVALTKSGINLYETLVLIKQTNSKKEIRRLANVLINSMQQGYTISDALATVKNIPAFIIGALKAGEVSGKFDSILETIVNQLKMEVEMTKTIKRVTLYPKFMIATIIAALVVCLKFIFPTFIDMYSGQGAQLPWVTLMLISATNFVNNYYQWVAGIVILSIIAMIRLKKIIYIQKKIEWIKLKIPKVSYLYKIKQNKDLANYMGLLLESGLQLGEAVEIFKDSTSSGMMKYILAQSNMNMAQGKFLSDTLKDSPLIIPYMLEIIKIRENSGGLGQALLDIGKYLESDYEIELRKNISIIEPTLTLIIGLIVAGIAAAIMMPTIGLAITF